MVPKRSHLHPFLFQDSFLSQDPIRRRLQRLYDRKFAIDQLIRSLESYGQLRKGPEPKRRATV